MESTSTVTANNLVDTKMNVNFASDNNDNAQNPTPPVDGSSVSQGNQDSINSSMQQLNQFVPLVRRFPIRHPPENFVAKRYPYDYGNPSFSQFQMLPTPPFPMGQTGSPHSEISSQQPGQQQSQPSQQQQQLTDGQMSAASAPSASDMSKSTSDYSASNSANQQNSLPMAMAYAYPPRSFPGAPGVPTRNSWLPTASYPSVSYHNASASALPPHTSSDPSADAVDQAELERSRLRLADRESRTDDAAMGYHNQNHGRSSLSAAIPQSASSAYHTLQERQRRQSTSSIHSQSSTTETAGAASRSKSSTTKSSRPNRKRRRSTKSASRDDEDDYDVDDDEGGANVGVEYIETSGNTGTENRKYQCPYCEKRFTRPSSLQTHTYTHTGERPFACHYDGCGKRFSVLSNLRRHQKIHVQAENQPDSSSSKPASNSSSNPSSNPSSSQPQHQRHMQMMDPNHSPQYLQQQQQMYHQMQYQMLPPQHSSHAMPHTQHPAQQMQPMMLVPMVPNSNNVPAANSMMVQSVNSMSGQSSNVGSNASSNNASPQVQVSLPVHNPIQSSLVGAIPVDVPVTVSSINHASNTLALETLANQAAQNEKFNEENVQGAGAEYHGSLGAETLKETIENNTNEINSNAINPVPAAVESAVSSLEALSTIPVSTSPGNQESQNAGNAEEHNELDESF